MSATLVPRFETHCDRRLFSKTLERFKLPPWGREDFFQKNSIQKENMKLNDVFRVLSSNKCIFS